MFLTIVGIFLVIPKYTLSIMILLITFIAHHLLKYINLRLNRTINRDLSSNEPELFLFNESFDANLLNLKQKSIDSLNENDLYNSFELMKNLNKLYANEPIQFENESICAMDSFDFDSVNQNESMEVSDYIDLDDSVFNTILFEDNKNNSIQFENAKDFESMLTKSDTKILLLKDPKYENLCQSLGFFTKSNSSFASFSSTPSAARTKAKSFKCFKSSVFSKMNDSSKTKKFRSRIERLRQTKNFYRRQRTSSLNVQTMTQIENVFTQIENDNNKVKSYKPSFKVEKLLNDSRGMKKYLIDYDFLMSHQRKRKNTVSLNNLNSLRNELDTTASLLSSSTNSMSSIDIKLNENDEWCDKLRGPLFCDIDDKENSLQMNIPSSNRCSSGYLSDC